MADNDFEKLEPVDVDEMDIVTLNFDNGETVNCGVVAIYPAGENEYIGLVPLDENKEQVGDEVYIYRFINNGEDEEPDLQNIEDDDEYEIAADAFDELMDSWEFDEEE